MDTNKNTIFPDKLFFFSFAGIFSLLAFLPDAIIWLTQPPGLVFNGAIVNIDDANVYLSAIRQGAEGAWLFTPQFTPEGLPAHISFFPYLLAGKIQNIAGGPSLFWMYLLRLLSLALAFFALLHLLRTMFPDKLQTQKTAYLMLLFSGGFGWLITILTGQPSQFTPELTVPEWNTITSALSAPHFLMGIAFQAYFFTAFIKLSNQISWKNIIALTLAGIALGLTYPFLIAVDGFVLAVYFLVQSIQHRSIPWKLLLTTGIACLPMIAYLIYYGLYLPQDPVWKLSLIANNQIEPPPPLGVLVGFGLLAIFLLPAIKSIWKQKKLALLLFWFAANFLALYLPLSFSGRFVLGMYIPISILAAYSLEEFILPKLNTDSKFQPGSTRKLALWFTIPSTLLFILWAVIGAKTTLDYPYYYQQPEVEAVEWLSQHTTQDDIILADYPISNLIPRYAQGLVFIGHLNLTINLDEKLELRRTFWQADTSQSWRDQFIKEWHITYIYQGRFENALSGGTRLDLPYEVVYTSEQITIYRVQ